MTAPEKAQSMSKRSSTHLPGSVSHVGMASFIPPLRFAMTLMWLQVMDVVALVRLSPNATRTSMPFLSVSAAMESGMTQIFQPTKHVMTATLMKTTAALLPAQLSRAGTAARPLEASAPARKKSAGTTTWS